MKKQCDICGLDFDGHWRAKRCGAKCRKEYHRRWALNAYATNPAYREYQITYCRERWATDAGYRNRSNERKHLPDAKETARICRLRRGQDSAYREMQRLREQARRKSDRGREVIAIWKNSPSGLASRARRQRSAATKATQSRYRERERMKDALLKLFALATKLEELAREHATQTPPPGTR